MPKLTLGRALLGAVLLIALGASAQTLVNFTAGSPAVAADINGNFQTVRTPPGTIILYAGAATPAGWIECDGRLATGFPDLALVLGTTYGGGTEVRVPNLVGRVGVGIDTASAVIGGGRANALGKLGGVELQTQVPQHTHPITGACNSGTTCGNSTDGLVRGPPSGGPLPGSSTGVAGGVSVMQPYVTLRYLIKT